MNKLALIVGTALVLAGCTVNTPGNNNNSTSSSSVPAPSTSTVMVVTAPARTTHKTVTVTQAAAQPVVAPQTSSGLLGLYNSSNQVDTGSYFNDSGAFFDAPSQNIGCQISPSGIVCSITRYDFPQPGPDCNAGIAAQVYSDGSPSLGDCSSYFPVRNRGTVLNYGQSIGYDDLGCVSESTGVSCMNTSTGIGFTISKQAYSPVYG